MTLTLDSNSPPPTMSIALVLPALEQYARIVHSLYASPLLASLDFSYAAPIYKGSDAIKTGLLAASGALEKFDVYFTHAFLDEGERLRFSRLFAQRYLAGRPGSERSDLFLASAEVLKVAGELVSPSSLDEPEVVLAAIAHAPHDGAALKRLRALEPIDRAHLRFEVRLFLDHVMNPRRRAHPEVQQAMQQLETELPYILEVVSDGALAGFFHFALQPLVEQAGGRLVWLRQ